MYVNETLYMHVIQTLSDDKTIVRYNTEQVQIHSIVHWPFIDTDSYFILF